MKPRTIEVDDIVQLSPEGAGNRAFAGCLMVVTEVYSWGAQGYVQALGGTCATPGRQAYYRARWEEMEPTGGIAPWRVSP